jgi:hypothetical protein
VLDKKQGVWKGKPKGTGTKAEAAQAIQHKAGNKMHTQVVGDNVEQQEQAWACCHLDC